MHETKPFEPRIRVLNRQYQVVVEYVNIHVARNEIYKDFGHWALQLYSEDLW